MLLQPAVFIDRDGTLNRSVVRDGKPYPPATLGQFHLIEGVTTSCARLKAAGYVLVVATNQPDVGRGSQSKATIELMHARLLHLIPEISRIEVCYDAGGSSPPSEFRKPAPGMLLRAASELGLDLANSWMIGDRWSDIDAGHSAGCRTIFIDWGYLERSPKWPPHFTVKSLVEATGVILARH